MKNKKIKSNGKNIKLMYLKGDIDESNVEKIKKEIIRKLSDVGTDRLIINIKELDYINSIAIGGFAEILDEFHGKGKTFVFTEPNENITDILELVNMPSLISVYDTNEEAMLFFEE